MPADAGLDVGELATERLSQSPQPLAGRSFLHEKWRVRAAKTCVPSGLRRTDRTIRNSFRVEKDLQDTRPHQGVRDAWRPASLLPPHPPSPVPVFLLRLAYVPVLPQAC